MELLIRFILLCIVITLSDADEEKKILTGTKGGTITLPDAVLEKGFLLYEGNVIALVKNKELDILEDIYVNRLHWTKTSGLFTLTDLQRRDSGIYKIDSKKGNNSTISIYNLTVYDSVAPPAVHRLSVSSDSCSLLCAVDKAAEITLWWYKDEEIVNQSSSDGSLLLTVTKQDLSSSYRCVAGNPAEDKTFTVDLQTSCGLNFTDSAETTEPRNRGIIIGVSAGCAGLVVAVALAAFLIKRKYFSQNKTTTTGRQGLLADSTGPVEPPADQNKADSVNSKTDVQYAEVNICGDRPSEDSPGSVDRSNLTTVYDKLEVHRMVLPDSDANVS